MFTWLARGIVRRPLVTVLAWLVLVVISAIGAFTGFGGKGLFERLETETGTVPGTESAQVYDLTQQNDDKGVTVTMVVRGLDLADQAQAGKVAAWMAGERTKLGDIDGVETVVDAFAFDAKDPRGQAFMSKDADGFVVVTTLEKGLGDEDSEKAQAAVVDEIARASDEIGDKVDGADAIPMSNDVISQSILDQVEHDLIRGEAIGLPIALLLMVLVFGGLIAAGLPLAGALTSIVLGMFGLWLLTHVIGIDSFILNVISLIGLALSIDYGLLVVSRFREEAHARLEEAGYPGDGSRLPDVPARRALVRDAVEQTVMTAGRTVSFSALTIACAILGLLVMRSPVLRTIGMAGVLVTLLAVMTAVTLVPALLALLGRFILAPSPMTKVPGLRAIFNRVSDISTDEGIFSKLARWVHRHPWSVMLVVSAILVAMCLPFSTLKMRNDFEEFIPKDSGAYAAFSTLNNDYPALATPSITVIADTPVAESANVVDHLGKLDGVVYVSQPTKVSEVDDRTVVSVRVDAEDQVGEKVTNLMKDLREWDPGYDVLVGGPAAGQYDFNQSIAERAPIAVGIMALAVLVLMFLMTGSVIVPIKALLINMLSLVASLGFTWFLFEHGLFGLPQVHGLATFVVAVAISFGFGLAMDYEVFLLARIKEYWDSGIGNDLAVERGLQRSGRIITSAAAIIVAVFLGFVLGDMLAIKQIGVALAIVVITDATLVRMLLVPATMTLLGQWNWWAPGWLKRIYEKFGIVH